MIPEPPENLSEPVIIGHLKNLEGLSPKALKNFRKAITLEILHRRFRLKNCSQRELVWLYQTAQAITPVPWYRKIWKRQSSRFEVIRVDTK